MHRPATQRSYSDRIGRVVEHLVEHLDQPLTLDQLAAIGNFSPYHFHRIYRGLMGETVADTLRRMRLHRAAVDLLHSNRTLDAIVRRCGYGSGPAFNRAFAQSYGLPPGEFRRRRGEQRPALPSPPNEEDLPVYDVTITDRAPVTVAAMRHRGDYQTIGDTFQKLAVWAAGRGLGAARTFGIYHDDPDAKPRQELMADACIEIHDDIAPDGNVRRIALPGGRYAVLVHVGPYAELPRAYRWLFGKWLPDSGEEAANAPPIEEYLNNPQTLPPSEWRTAICLPLG